MPGSQDSSSPSAPKAGASVPPFAILYGCPTEPDECTRDVGVLEVDAMASAIVPLVPPESVAAGARARSHVAAPPPLCALLFRIHAPGELAEEATVRIAFDDAVLGELSTRSKFARPRVLGHVIPKPAVGRENAQVYGFTVTVAYRGSEERWKRGIAVWIDAGQVDAPTGVPIQAPARQEPGKTQPLPGKGVGRLLEK